MPSDGSGNDGGNCEEMSVRIVVDIDDIGYDDDGNNDDSSNNDDRNLPDDDDSANGCDDCIPFLLLGSTI